jgi:hypothetical protein
MLVKMTLGRPGAFHSASAEVGVPEPIDYAMVAKDGTIWVGADSGLYRFMYPFQMEYWDQSHGIGITGSILLKGNDVYATSTGLEHLNPSTEHWDRIPSANNFRGYTLDGPGDTFYVAGAGEGFAGKGGPGGDVAVSTFFIALLAMRKKCSRLSSRQPPRCNRVSHVSPINSVGVNGACRSRNKRRAAICRSRGKISRIRESSPSLLPPE